MNPTMHRLLAASAAIAALGAGASAQSAGPAEAPSSQTRAMILGPLMDELAPRAFAPRLAYESNLDTPGYVDREALRPDASRFARTSLAAGGPLPGLAPLSSFTAQTTTLASTPTSRLSVSLSGAGLGDMLFSDLRPDYVEAGGMRLAGLNIDRPRNMALRYETSFDAAGNNGLDIGIAPRAGVALGEHGPSYEAGATFRVGQFVSEELEGRPAWWLFAGADRETVLYNPGQRFDLREALAVREHAMIGDAQAGVAMRVYGADVSLAYVHRETTYSIPTHSWGTSEGFAAFSFSWRR